jgi:hypothetical protein
VSGAGEGFVCWSGMLLSASGFVNLLKAELVLMAQKVALQIQLQKMIPSSAMLDLFL